jgi:hypothetical protein
MQLNSCVILGSYAGGNLGASATRFSPRAQEYNRSVVKNISSTPANSAGILGSTPAIDRPSNVTPAKPKWDSKFSALQSQKIGLCMKCEEK